MSESPATSKHTPGPWHIGMKPVPIIYGPQGEHVADMSADLLMSDESAANARLIAAAPELLEAVKKAMLDLEDCMEHSSHLPEQVRMNATASIEQARAIIAKAEGGDNA